ncbi:DUF1905 domain-containing protein [Nocardioides sp. GY 10127]|uniref:DUF1905 domain-containing protein n=1 Tax=Nocardioides sp. GY 10127 TaxID=2569762 RepID=UPI0010A88392|nr:DUF1905 domain-containing protein [Nocardioides sp. GY 10127]TIC79970.1 DUF1905 domain-containing protein [Nocardioides sp. GY 10127]
MTRATPDAAPRGEQDGAGRPPAWEFDAEVWLHVPRGADPGGTESHKEGHPDEPAEPAPGSWCFCTLPAEVGEEVALLSGPRRGFGSVRVAVEVGGSAWATSVFPGSEGYVLPLKAAVRRAEGLTPGDVARVRLRLAG